MTDIQNEINARVEAFVAEVAELARQAAHDALASALSQAGATTGKSRRTTTTARPRRQGGKRTPEELNAMAEAFLDHVTKHPGQRMEQISKALGYTTTELTLPVKKLLNADKIRVEGQKRATQYYSAEADGGSNGATKSRSKSSGTRSRKRKTRRRKKS